MKITSSPKVGIGVIVRRENQVLFGLRKGSHGAGTWALPGGKLDPDETVIACAQRELNEEVGVEAAAFKPVGFWTPDLFPDDNLHFITLYVYCIWVAGEPQLLEPQKCERWGWFDWPSQLPASIFTGTDQLAQRYPDLDDLAASCFTP